MNQLADKTADIAKAYLADEMQLIRQYIQQIRPDVAERAEVFELSTTLINNIRSHPDFNKGLDAFMADWAKTGQTL